MKTVNLLSPNEPEGSAPSKNMERIYKEMRMYIVYRAISVDYTAVTMQRPQEVVGLEAILDHPNHTVVLYFLKGYLPPIIFRSFVKHHYSDVEFETVMEHNSHAEIICKLKEFLI